MDFSVDLLYLCLFFPVWTCLLIICCSAFLSFDSKKLTTIFSILSSVFPLIFGIFAGAKNIIFENSFPIISINEINIHFGTLINRTNAVLIGVFSLCLLIAVIMNYRNNQKEDNYNKYLFLLNMLNIFALGFFVSPNLLQLFTFYISFSFIFYCLENLRNETHERAKNFLVINKIGDFTLLSTIGALFFYNIFFSFQSGVSVLEIKDFELLLSGIQSVCEPQYILLFSLLMIIAVLIKSVLVFIHPLKSKNDVFMLAAVSATTGLYWILLFIPAFRTFEYFNIIFCSLCIICILSAVLTIYLKLFRHETINKINLAGTNVVKNIYLKFANCIKCFDTYVLDKTYEYISKISMKISGCFQFSSTKTTLYAFIFNILGICFLILLAWFIYNLTMKG